MKQHLGLGSVLVLLSSLALSNALAQSAPEAARKGYLYEGSRDVIVSKAKKEGSLRALLSVNPPTIEATKEAFTKKYPFLNCYFEEVTGDGQERFLLELQSGRVTDWDVISLSSENYEQLRPFVNKVDLLTMSKQNVLAIPAPMISPKDRNAVSLGVFADIAAYNSKLLKASEVPTSWEDFLKPAFKGKKFVLDIRPNYMAGLVPAKGMEWVLDYARKLAAQDPIWARGQTRTLASMSAGEYGLTLGTYFNSLMRARNRGMTQLEPIFMDPVPIRLGEAHGIGMGAKNIHAALLLLEFMASPEGQKIIDETDPGKASVYARGSMLEQVVGKRNLSVLDWDHFAKLGGYMEEIFKAYGFPTAKKTKK